MTYPQATRFPDGAKAQAITLDYNGKYIMIIYVMVLRGLNLYTK